MKKLIRKLTIINVLVLLWVLGGIFLFDKVALIIAFGLQGANLFIILNIAGMAALFAVGNAMAIISSRKSFKKPLPQISIISRKEGKFDPHNIRSDLHNLQPGNPEFADLLQIGITQLDNIDKKQAKLHEVRERNDAGALTEVAESVDEAEVGICKNLSKIIDRALLLNSLERSTAERESIFAENVGRIQNILKANADTLTLCDVLLTETINYLDEKNTSQDSSGAKLAAMTEAIQTLRQMSGREV